MVVAGGPTKSRDKYPDKRNISNSVCANRALCVNREQHHCFPLKRFGNKVVLVDKTKRGSTVKHESVWPLSSPQHLTTLLSVQVQVNFSRRSPESVPSSVPEKCSSPTTLEELKEAWQHDRPECAVASKPLRLCLMVTQKHKKNSNYKKQKRHEQKHTHTKSTKTK